MRKFNIAFVPKNNSRKFIALISKYENNSYNYFLGKNSIPHVTICQFYSNEEMAENIWNGIHSSISSFDIYLSFKQWSNLSFDDKLFWLSLLPEQSCQLFEIFNIVSKLVTPLRKDSYDPHLTLFNYFPKNLIVETLLSKNLFLEDEFELVMGECDEVGQLINIKFRNNNFLLRYRI